MIDSLEERSMKVVDHINATHTHTHISDAYIKVRRNSAFQSNGFICSDSDRWSEFVVVVWWGSAKYGLHVIYVTLIFIEKKIQWCSFVFRRNYKQKNCNFLPCYFCHVIFKWKKKITPEKEILRTYEKTLKKPKENNQKLHREMWITILNRFVEPHTTSPFDFFSHPSLPVDCLASVRALDLTTLHFRIKIKYSDIFDWLWARFTILSLKYFLFIERLWKSYRPMFFF